MKRGMTMEVHSFLLMGQSNAAGNGFLEEAEPLELHPDKFWVLRNGMWRKMYRPINPDHWGSGVCLAESFVKAYSEAHPDVAIGVIPCAFGGSGQRNWQPGQGLFDNAVNCARIAMRGSQLKAVLWHQGEDDCADKYYPHYYDNFQNVKNTLRQELEMPELPFILGGLADSLAKVEDYINYPYINEALQRIANDDPFCTFVPSTGLTCNPDNIHFNSKSLEELGLRYFAAYQKLEKTC